MQILSIDNSPFHEIPFRYVHTQGVQRVGQLPVFAGQVDQLPPAIDALVVTSDLQARELEGNRLLAEVLAAELCVLAEQSLIPPTSNNGVILAGDLYTTPSLDKRGGSGDVRDSWLDFASSFRWVTGVPGNHDFFGESRDQEAAFCRSRRIHLLDCHTKELDGIQFAGIGGIIGKPTKPRRRAESEYIRSMDHLLQSLPDICVLHQGPNVPDHKLFGEPSIRKRLLRHNNELLVICGHSHWRLPLIELSSHVQVLNVDMRVVVLTQEKPALD